MNTLTHLFEDVAFAKMLCAPAEIARFTDELIRDNGQLSVRFVRGKRMHQESDALDEFAAAWQFPWYFGRNWNAFSECICDLSWMAGTHLLCVVLDSEELLVEDEPDGLAVFMRIMTTAKEELGNPRPPPTPPSPARWFRSVLHCTEKNAARFEERFSSFREGIFPLRVANL